LKITAITPRLVKVPNTYWGEYFFIEINTDEGVTGWGEITTTTLVANRSVAGIIKQLNDSLVGEDPTEIERLWHKIFRSFTYMGSRGASTHAISGIDIALWDIRGKILEQPIYNLLGGKVRDDISLYTHPDQSNFNSDEGIEEEVRAIVESGHTAMKFDPFPHLGEQSAANDGYLSGKMPAEGERIAVEMTAKIREFAGPEIELLIDAHGRFDVPTAIRLCNSLEDAGQIDWFEEPVPVESHHALS
jgi:galactonate dehydratase